MRWWLAGAAALALHIAVFLAPVPRHPGQRLSVALSVIAAAAAPPPRLDPVPTAVAPAPPPPTPPKRPPKARPARVAEPVPEPTPAPAPAPEAAPIEAIAGDTGAPNGDSTGT